MSTPNWWGDWRPILTPHTGNLQPTDLLECTSIVGGLPVNTSITGAQIIAAASGSGASWGSITGTLSAQTDLQGALDNKVPYTGATADVDLGSHDLTATQGTFATGGSSDTLTVNHTSGSGKAITITKGGAGEGIYVNKTSGSGNAVTIVGDLEASTIKKTSGTSAEFLKADGSVDTTSYQPTLVSGTNIKTVNGNSLLGSGNLTISGGGLTVGTTAIASGTDGRVLFQAAGVLQQDASFFWDNTNKRLGVGATPATNVRLDVRAQGALSTDIAFRVRNSANTFSNVEFKGNGDYNILRSSGVGLICASSYLIMQQSAQTYIATYASGVVEINAQVAPFQINYQTAQLARFGVGGLVLGNANSPTTATNTLRLANGVAPSTNFLDHFWIYSADITAGNAAPHFRTENGDIVKLYRVGGWGLPTGTFTRTTFDTATVTTAELAERVAALIQDLRDNHQLFKA